MKFAIQFRETVPFTICFPLPSPLKENDINLIYEKNNTMYMYLITDKGI